MKVWQLDGAGKENFHQVERPRPVAGPGQVLVRTEAVSLNYRDKAIVDGTYPAPPKFPLVLASDLAGEVVSVGDGVTRVKAGERVMSVFKPRWIDGRPTPEDYNATLGSPLPGVLAEYVVLAEDGVLTYPEYLTPAEASALPIAAVTAWAALFKYGQLAPEHTVLVQGSGGVALAALQLAAAAGCRVIALTRSEDKVERLKALGASEVIETKKTPDWAREVRARTGGRGVDQVVEVLGGGSLQRSIAACAWGGQVALIGFMDEQNASVSVPATLSMAIRLQGVGVGSQKDTRDLLAFLERHHIAPVIDAEYGFDAVPEALEHLDRGPFGKVVVTVP